MNNLKSSSNATLFFKAFCSIADSDESNNNEDDVYETIEFSDSSTHIYTEPVRPESTMRTRARKIITVPPTAHPRTKTLNQEQLPRKTTKNYHRFRAETQLDLRSTDEEDEDNLELRTKPYKTFATNSKRGSSKVLCSLVSVGQEFQFVVDK